jgi:CheY-like chemotaxis protein
MENEVRVLLALSDRTLSQNIIDKFHHKYPTCPLVFDITEDGQRALNEVRFFKPQVAVIDRNFPGLAGEELAQGILSAYSECNIILAVGKNQKEDQMTESGLTQIELPILSWDRALLEITRGLPIDFQIQYSLFERNQLLFGRLEAYALKYSEKRRDEEIVTRAWNFAESGLTGTAPSSLESNQGGVAEKSSSSITNHLTQNSKASNQKISFKAARLEVTVISILGALVGFSWFRFELEGAFGWTLRLSLLATLMFCCLGFFALRWSIKD